MGRDDLLELLGDFELLDAEEYRAKLIKEALKRASQKEKQQYITFLLRKSELSQKIAEINSTQEALNEKDKLNVLPEMPTSCIRASTSRQAKEAAENAVRKRYREELDVYRTQNSVILAERMKLMQDFLTLKAELDELEEAETWLLLSMAIRNQSSLLGFMQKSEDSDKK